MPLPRPLLGLAVLAAVAAAPATLVSAQVEDPVPDPVSTTTTTTSTSTSTTTTSTTAPPPPPQPQPPGEGGPEAPPEAPPTDTPAIPPSTSAQPPDPAATGLMQRLSGATLRELQTGLRTQSSARDTLARRVLALTDEIAGLTARVERLRGEEAAAASRLTAARDRLRRRAVSSYVRGSTAEVDRVLRADSFAELSRAAELLRSVLQADRTRTEEYRAAQLAAGSEIVRLVAALDEGQSRLATDRVLLDGLDQGLLERQVQLDAARVGGELVGRGFTFPVLRPRTFADTWGAPRMFGTSYAHLHQGTDIFAPAGTPLVAVERGVLQRVGTDVLGGIKLWLAGASGTKYFYAHMSAYAEGVAEGKVVERGEVVGYVGTSGNAVGTSPHLHFQLHPGGGAPVNPFPLLRVVDQVEARLAQARPAPS